MITTKCIIKTNCSISILDSLKAAKLDFGAVEDMIFYDIDIKSKKTTFSPISNSEICIMVSSECQTDSISEDFILAIIEKRTFDAAKMMRSVISRTFILLSVSSSVC